MINQASWITAGKEVTAPIIVRKFQAKKVASATLSITGLGYFLCKINGQALSEDKFMPVFSDYRKRDFSTLLYPVHDKEFKHRVYYLDFSVGNLIKEGENLLEIRLGNGWYNQTKRTVEGKLSFGDSLPTRYALTLNYQDGSKCDIFSDGSESWKPSEILENNVFYGEKHDIRKVKNLFDSKGWQKVQILPDFQTELTLQTCPNERIIRRIIPKLVSKTNSYQIFDAGEVITGWAKVKASGKSGEKLIISYASLLDENGQLDAYATGAYMQNDKGEYQLQKDEFILDCTKTELAPKFCRHCFRYFKVEGDVSAIQSVDIEVVHTDLKVEGEFKSSSSVLNWIYKAFVATELCNMHDGFPSDCPHRERLGYTGDGQMTAMSAMLTLSSREFYKKWIQDIVDGQNQINGHVQHTAPFMGGGGGPGGWGGAIIFVINAYFERYGEVEIVKKYFNNMLKYVEYMQSHSTNGLVTSAEKDCWCLGDWASQDKNLLSPVLVNSVLFIHALKKLCKMAKSIGYTEWIDKFETIIKEIKRSIKKEFYDKQTCSFDGGRTGADAFALSVGLGNGKTLSNLVEKYSKLGRVDTGFIGTYYLIKTLFEKGQVDLAYRLLTTTKKGSYGYMKKQGATTINEHLDMGKYVSDCHPMFGSVCEFLFTQILGLQVGNGKDYLISPRIPRKLKRAKAKMLVDGKLVIAQFSRNNDNLVYTATIPQGINAKLVYNNKTYKLSQGKNQIRL